MMCQMTKRSRNIKTEEKPLDLAIRTWVLIADQVEEDSVGDAGRSQKVVWVKE